MLILSYIQIFWYQFLKLLSALYLPFYWYIDGETGQIYTEEEWKAFEQDPWGKVPS